MSGGGFISGTESGPWDHSMPDSLRCSWPAHVPIIIFRGSGKNIAGVSVICANLTKLEIRWRMWSPGKHFWAYCSSQNFCFISSTSFLSISFCLFHLLAWWGGGFVSSWENRDMSSAYKQEWFYLHTYISRPMFIPNPWYLCITNTQWKTTGLK